MTTRKVKVMTADERNAFNDEQILRIFPDVSETAVRTLVELRETLYAMSEADCVKRDLGPTTKKHHGRGYYSAKTDAVRELDRKMLEVLGRDAFAEWKTDEACVNEAIFASRKLVEAWDRRDAREAV